MWLYSPVDSTGNLITIEKLVLGGTWIGDLPIFIPDELISAPSWQCVYLYFCSIIVYINFFVAWLRAKINFTFNTKKMVAALHFCNLNW